MRKQGSMKGEGTLRGKTYVIILSNIFSRVLLKNIIKGFSKEYFKGN